jgi:hypothetical protein
MVDESTDTSSVKNLAITARSVKNNYTVQDEFLALLPIVDASANGIYSVIIEFLQKHKIPYKRNLVGFASDGANNMMGSNHSLQVLLKKDVPNLYVMKCLPHSLALCASYSCLKLQSVYKRTYIKSAVELEYI